MLLLGGGFALAKAIDVSGLSYWIGSQLEVLDFLDPAVLCLIVCAGAALATEVTSNVATVSILLPILENLSYSLGLNPLYLMIPATLSCSFAFMLPVATPPNAIVYGASGMRTSVMVSHSSTVQYKIPASSLHLADKMRLLDEPLLYRRQLSKHQHPRRRYL